MIELKNKEKLYELLEFGEDRVYILLAIARSTDNEDIRASNQPNIRKIIEDEDELEDKIEQLQHATSRFDADYRLYCTVNARNSTQAAYFLQNKITEWSRRIGMGDDTSRAEMKKVDHRWKSILHKNESRDDSYFLFDLDSTNREEWVKLLNEVGRKTGFITKYETPNGFHLITEPFNYNELNMDIEYELKKDDMMFVGWL